MQIGYYSIIILCGLIFSTGVILLKRIFFNLALKTVGLLNVLLDNHSTEDEKYNYVLKGVGGQLLALLWFLLGLAIIIFLSVLPFYIFVNLTEVSQNQKETSSWIFWLALTLGSILPFLLLPLVQTKQSDYSPVSKLLHHLVLDNYNLSRRLFSMDKRSIKKPVQPQKDFLIVTGLARAGTTALTELLYKNGKFFSLSYANMPFLMSPRLWKKIHHPKKVTLKERSHGDRVLFGVNTVEALEEYFFKNLTNDSYVKEDKLQEHTISKEIYDDYIIYQELLRSKKTDQYNYLAKNNNFLLRYRSLRDFNETFKVICMFRDPLEHAYSLMKQHQQFTKKQEKDAFILSYMNWLGHHEFGINHKPFEFSNSPFESQYTPNQIEYWLGVWINYYSYVLSILPQPNFLLIQYQAFANHPNDTLGAIRQYLDYEIEERIVEPFINTNTYKGVPPQHEMLTKALSIHNELIYLSTKVN